MEKTIMIADVPHMVEQWDFEKNIESITIIPAKRKAGKYYWVCKRCGYSWSATPYARFRSSGACPCCDSNKAIQKGINDVFTVVPDLKEWYDFDKNIKIDIYTQGVSSLELVYWKCPDCGRSWKTSISTRIKKNGNHYSVIPCPHFNTVKRKRDEVPKISDAPHLLRFWDYEKNSLNPEITPVNSTKTVYWRCRKCGHEWQSSIDVREKSTHKCPCCELGLVIRQNVNDFFTLFPDALSSYDFEKNKDIDTSCLSIRSTVSLWWKCEKCGYEWKSSVASRVRKQNGERYLSKCQQCYFHDTSRIISVASIPQLLNFWDFEKNETNHIDPALVSAHATIAVWWKCKECGYSWRTQIQSRFNSSGLCPCCGTRKAVTSGKNDIFSLVPELKLLYDFEKNTNIDIQSKSVFSNEAAHFFCKKCGYRWVSPIKKRIRKGKDDSLQVVGCPKCDNRVLRKISYAEQYPQLESIFNKRLNGCSLSSVKSKESNTIKYWWTCKRCQNDFQSRLQSMITSLNTETQGCPYCSNTIVLPGQSFGDAHPDLLDEYAPTNNYDPYKVFPNSKYHASWVCRNNSDHTWKASFAQRHAGYGNCPICNRTKLIPGENTFADIYKDCISLWSPNNSRGPNEVFYNSSLWIKWICPDCLGEYGAYIKDVVHSRGACPYCSEQRVLPGKNSLLVCFPDLAKYWSPNNERSADTVLPKSRFHAKWLCPDCHGEYTALISDMVSGEADCPYCNDRQVLPGFNSLAKRYPNIAELWSSSNERSADNVLPRSKSQAKWLCPDCHGEYSALIVDIVSGEATCPYCNDRQVLPGFNSFAVRHDDLLQEWDMVNNHLVADPDQIGDRCQTSVWWICPKEPTHEYMMPPARRLLFQKRHREACPYCKGLRRKKRHFV